MAAGGAGPKQAELQPHPVKEQLPGVDYCLNSPPGWAEAVILGFQHYIVMLGTTALIPSALVPQMGGSSAEKATVIQTLLFVAGINTLLQSYFGSRLPAVMGGSYTYVLPTVSIILADRYSNIADPHQRFSQTVRGIQGALIVASCFQIILGFSGLWRNVVRLVTPLSAVPPATLTGLGLYYLGFSGVARCIEIGLPALIFVVILSQYIPHFFEVKKSIFYRYGILLYVAVVWMYAHFLTVGGAYKNKPPTTQYSCQTDRAGLISSARWISVPYPFQWGAPTFNAGEAFAMIAASFASLTESTATFIVLSRYAGATHVPSSVLSRGVGWQGLGVLLGGVFGTVNGSAPLPENAGLMALTRVGSRRVLLISAGFMIFFSIFGKFGALFASIPMPIFAALYCLFFAYVASAGLGYLQFCNLNSFRTKFILGFSLFMGFSIPQYFKEHAALFGFGPISTRSSSFNDMLSVIFSSSTTVATIFSLFLDCTLHHNDAGVLRDNGWHWFENYRSFKGDERSKEFYSLPYNLNKYFPSI